MDSETDREVIAGLAEAAGLHLPEDRFEIVGEALAGLLELADTLDELPLEGVEPAPPHPRWS